MSLHQLSEAQKSQFRNAFTLIDGDSDDSSITKLDLLALYKTLGLPVPTNSQISSMLGSKKESVNFAQFSKIMADEFAKFDDSVTIRTALEVFGDQQIDVEKLKETCCSVQLGAIGLGDNRLTRNSFDQIVDGFVKEGIDGQRVLLSDKWMGAYFE